MDKDITKRQATIEEIFLKKNIWGITVNEN
jgi:hypothetical protein